MLVAGAVNFVVFIQRRNNYQSGGRLQRMVTSVREVNGVDGRVLSSEVFAEAPDGQIVPHAPIACVDELVAHGLPVPAGLGVSTIMTTHHSVTGAGVRGHVLGDLTRSARWADCSPWKSCTRSAAASPSAADSPCSMIAIRGTAGEARAREAEGGRTGERTRTVRRSARAIR